MIFASRRLPAHIPCFWQPSRTLQKTIPKRIQIDDFRLPTSPGPYSLLPAAPTNPTENHIQTYPNRWFPPLDASRPIFLVSGRPHEPYGKPCLNISKSMIFASQRLPAHIPCFRPRPRTRRKTMSKHIQINDFRVPTPPSPYSLFPAAPMNPSNRIFWMRYEWIINEFWMNPEWILNRFWNASAWVLN